MDYFFQWSSHLTTILAASHDTMAALPASHDELRTRLEAAGIPSEQIAVVMKDPNPQGHLADLSPPPYSRRDLSGILAAPNLAERLNEVFEQRNRVPAIIFKAHFVQGADKKKVHQKIVRDGLPKSQATWTAEFLQNTGFSKEPNLRVFRQTDKGEKGHQVCECVFHHRMSKGVNIKHPWYNWPDEWDPNTEPWGSDTGFLDEAWMQWQYYSTDSRYPDQACLFCETVEKMGKDANHEPKGLEVCRVILQNDVSPVLIELPGAPWKNATEEQMDEMVSNALINYWRRQLGWWKDRRPGGGSSSGDSGGGTAALTASVSACAATTSC